MSDIMHLILINSQASQRPAYLSCIHRRECAQQLALNYSVKEERQIAVFLFLA